MNLSTKQTAIPRLTTAEIALLKKVQAGYQVYDTTLSVLKTYNGTAFVVSGVVTVSLLTNAQIAALTGMVTGQVVYNTDTNAFSVYNGAAWE